jgi:hypothetical protein
MIANIRTIMSSQTDVTKTINMEMSLHLFVYQMSKPCKLLTVYTSCEVVYLSKVVPINSMNWETKCYEK